jgi:signal transduction histidine kinase
LWAPFQRRGIEKARGALQKLGSAEIAVTSLERALTEFGNEFLSPGTRLRILVTGHARRLDTATQEQIQLIARDAMSNAFRHANATIVEVEIEYLSSSLRVCVRDNGSGIDERVFCFGQSPHFGILGMHERTRIMGGRIRIWTKKRVGTEVEICLPLKGNEVKRSSS